MTARLNRNVFQETMETLRLERCGVLATNLSRDPPTAKTSLGIGLSWPRESRWELKGA